MGDTFFFILLMNKKRFACWSIQVLFRKDCQHKHTLFQSPQVSACRLFSSAAATTGANIPSAEVRKKLCVKLGTRQGEQLTSNTSVEDATCPKSQQRQVTEELPLPGRYLQCTLKVPLFFFLSPADSSLQRRQEREECHLMTLG